MAASKLRLILYTIMAVFRQQTPVDIIYCYGCLLTTNSGLHYTLLWLPLVNKLRLILYTVMAAFRQQTPVDIINTIMADFRQQTPVDITHCYG